MSTSEKVTWNSLLLFDQYPCLHGYGNGPLLMNINFPRYCTFRILNCHVYSVLLCMYLCFCLRLFVLVLRVIHRVLKTLMLQGCLYEVTLEYMKSFCVSRS
jgi:hypothetical protein